MDVDVYVCLLDLIRAVLFRCNVGPASGLTVLCNVLLNRPNVTITKAIINFGYIIVTGQTSTNPMDAVSERF